VLELVARLIVEEGELTVWFVAVTLLFDPLGHPDRQALIV
jgi:hypothetical protein